MGKRKQHAALAGRAPGAGAPPPARRGRLRTALAIAALVPAAAGAHKYVSLPILVNFCGSYDSETFESREKYIEALKAQIEMACKDINLRLLNTPPAGAGQDLALRLGPITWRDLETCPDDVTQGSAGLRGLFAESRKELASRLAGKGVKVNVVNVVREAPREGETQGRPIAAVAETGAEETIKSAAGGTRTVHHGRSVVIDDHTLTFAQEIIDEDSGETELCGTNGEILLHEIGHNSGLVLKHGAGDANETGFMSTPPTRTITRAQWDMLEQFWERFGEKSANDQQHSWAPRTDDTHSAYVEQPWWPAQPAVASLTMAIGPTGWLYGRVALADLLPIATPFRYDISLAIDTDDNLATGGLFFEYGPGYEFLMMLGVKNFPDVGTPPVTRRVRDAAHDSPALDDGQVIAFGALTYFSGHEYVTVPLDSVRFAEEGSIGMGAEYAPHANAITFAHDISRFPISPGTIPAKAKLVKDGIPAGYVTATFSPVLDPSLPSLPLTVQAFGPVTLTGRGFARESAVAVRLTHVKSFANEPVAAGATNNAGDFSLPVDVTGSRAGDFVLAAMDAAGNLATGVVTADIPCSLVCTAAAPARTRIGALVLFASSITPNFCSDPVSIEWRFGDGSLPSPLPDPTHVYQAPGVYDWSFTARSGTASCGAIGSIIAIDPATAVRRSLRHR